MMQNHTDIIDLLAEVLREANAIFPEIKEECLMNYLSKTFRETNETMLDYILRGEMLSDPPTDAV